jgi:hypothetical protein
VDQPPDATALAPDHGRSAPLPATWRAAVAGLDLLTAACAAINLAYFCYRLSAHPPETAPRRAAALVLAVVSFATVVESVALPGRSLRRALARGGARVGARPGLAHRRPGHGRARTAKGPAR